VGERSTVQALAQTGSQWGRVSGTLLESEVVFFCFGSYCKFHAAAQVLTDGLGAIFDPDTERYIFG